MTAAGALQPENVTAEAFGIEVDMDYRCFLYQEPIVQETIARGIAAASNKYRYCHAERLAHQDIRMLTTGSGLMVVLEDAFRHMYRINYRTVEFHNDGLRFEVACEGSFCYGLCPKLIIITDMWVDKPRADLGSLLDGDGYTDTEVKIAHAHGNETMLRLTQSVEVKEDACASSIRQDVILAVEALRACNHVLQAKVNHIAARAGYYAE